MTAWRAGFGMADITTFEPGLGVFGWGDLHNVPDHVVTRLFARVMVLEERATRRRMAYVVCDLGMISESVRQEVARRVCTPDSGLSDHDLTISATHTHAGPGGFSTYLFYAISIPGVAARVHEEIVCGICSAIANALAALRPARAFVRSGWIAASEPIAFNRSLNAYNRNVDATPLPMERRDEALDRTMTVLRVEDEQGIPMGLVSWFAVHGTSIHSDNRAIHADNKGYAATDCEAWARDQGYPGFVALFAQACAGDVSPNYRWHTRRHCTIGRYDDDDASARMNGEVQARHARALFALARTDGTELSGPLETGMRYRDFFDRTADARFAPGADARTGAPRLGIAFSVGTLDGPGPLFDARKLFPLFTRVQHWSTRREPQGSWRKPHGGKFPFWDFGAGKDNKVLGRLPLLNPIMYLFRDRYADYYRHALKTRAARDYSWVPRYLPAQQTRIGSLVVASLPNEPTTIAGRRLRRAVGDAWAGADIETVVVTGYANAYCGYLTTPEEYEVQNYEGASTLYGQWSLPVWCTEMAALTAEMRSGLAHATLGELPPHIPLDWCQPAPTM